MLFGTTERLTIAGETDVLFCNQRINFSFEFQWNSKNFEKSYK